MAGFTEQWAKRLQTVVDEIVNNAIEHGSIAGEMLEIEFQIEEQHAISVMVKNGPNGKSHMTAAELNAKLAEVKNEGEKPRIGLRGRGLQIIANWCDEVAFVEVPGGGVALRIKKFYRPDEWQEKSMVGSTNVLVLEV